MFSGAANRSCVSHVFPLMGEKFLHQRANRKIYNHVEEPVWQQILQHRRGLLMWPNEACCFWMNLATVWSDLKPHRWFCVYWNHEPEQYFCCSAHLLPWLVSLKGVIRKRDSLKSPCWKSGVNQDTHCLQCVCVSAPVWVFSHVCVSQVCVRLN